MKKNPNLVESINKVRDRKNIQPLLGSEVDFDLIPYESFPHH